MTNYPLCLNGQFVSFEPARPVVSPATEEPFAPARPIARSG
jgi:hypothetical protein